MGSEEREEIDGREKRPEGGGTEGKKNGERRKEMEQECDREELEREKRDGRYGRGGRGRK